MPACFQLIDRMTGAPEKFQVIDNRICQHFELPWSAEKYALGWYDTIGFMLALGKSFPQITDYLRDDARRDGRYAEYYSMMLRINHFIMEHYESSAWYER